MEGKAAAFQQPALGQCDGTRADSANDATEAVMAGRYGNDGRSGSGHGRIARADEQPRVLVERIELAVSPDGDAG